MKHKVNYRHSELPEFLKKLGELIHDRATEVEKSLIDRAKYELRSQYHSFKVPESKWFAMTPPQQHQHLTSFTTASLLDISCDENVGNLFVGRDMSASSALSVHFCQKCQSSS